MQDFIQYLLEPASHLYVFMFVVVFSIFTSFIRRIK